MLIGMAELSYEAMESVQGGDYIEDSRNLGNTVGKTISEAIIAVAMPFTDLIVGAGMELNYWLNR
jgi:hypothetical protein